MKAMKPTRVTEKWREQIEKGLMPESVSKTYIPEVTASEGGDGIRKAAFVVSTGSEDRDGDTVAPEGWMLDNYRKNPVVLWAHDVKSLPIARAESIGVQGGKLKSVIVFPDKGVYPFADQVFGLVKGGFIRGTSVGFHPVEAAPRKGVKKGVDFKRQELYEFSLLPIPSNREALAEAKAAGHDIGMVVKWASEFLDYAEANGLWIPKFQIEKALAQVRNLTVTVPAMPPPEAGVGSEDHAIAGAVLSDDEAKGFLDMIEKAKDPKDRLAQVGNGQDEMVPPKKCPHCGKTMPWAKGATCPYCGMDMMEKAKKEAEPEVVKVLGRHKTRADAVNQLQAIEASKHASGKGAEPVVEKGDVEGHAFHGNQYSGGKDGDGGSEAASRAEERGGKASWLNAAIAQHNAEVRSTPIRALSSGAKERAAKAVDSLKSSGGFSINTVTGASPQSGYMVSPYKANERVIDGDASADDIARYEADNANLLDKPGHFLGGWKDGGKTYLDVSLNVPSRAEAHALGAKHGQLEVWNVTDQKSEKVSKKRKKEIDMDIVTKLADDLFGEETKAAPPWNQEGQPQPDAQGKVDPAEAAKAAKDSAKAQNDEAESAAEAAAETPADEAAEPPVPGGDPSEADPQLSPLLDQLAQGLLAEIEPLKQGGDPTQVATGLKAALEKFAAAFMQTYIVPGAQAAPAGTPVPPPAAPPAAKPAAVPPPPAAPAAPPAKPAMPPMPPGQAPQAAPAAPAPPAQKPPFPPKAKKGFEVEDLMSLEAEEVRATIQKVVRRQMDDARMHLTGRLPG
jgi:HK97 family phage prohead protease